MMLLAYGPDKTTPPNADCKSVWFYGYDEASGTGYQVLNLHLFSK